MVASGFPRARIGLLALLVPAALATSAAAEDLELVCSGELQAFPLPPFALFDVDDDRRITRQEASGCETLDLMFSRLDLDATDSLTLEEYGGFAELWQRRTRSLDTPLD